MIVNSETSTSEVSWLSNAPDKAAAEYCVQTFARKTPGAANPVRGKSSLSSHLAVLAAKLIEAGRSLTEICVWLSLPLANLLDLVVLLGLTTPHDRPRRQYHAARFWTDAQISLLLKLWLTDITIDDLVLRIGRPRKSVLAKARQFRLLVRERAALQVKAAGAAQAVLPLPLPASTAGSHAESCSSARNSEQSAQIDLLFKGGPAASHAQSCASARNSEQSAQIDLLFKAVPAARPAESCSSAKAGLQADQAGVAFTRAGGLLLSLNGVKAVAEAADRDIITAPANIFALADPRKDNSAVLPLAKPRRPRICWDPYRPEILRGVDRGLSTIALGIMLGVPPVLIEKVRWRMSIPAGTYFIRYKRFWDGAFDDSPYSNVLDHIGYRAEKCCLCLRPFAARFRSELGNRLVIKKCRHCEWTEANRIDRRAQRAEYRRPSGSTLRTIPPATTQWMQPFMIPPARPDQPRMKARS